MFIHSGMTALSRRTRVCPRDRQRTRFAPRIEGLEGRALLSTWTVSSDADSGPGSLRARVAVAVVGDTIVFDKALKGHTIKLTSGAIEVTQDLTIQGPGAGLLAISGNGASRIFEFGGDGTTFAVSGLTLENGSALYGAGIYDTDVDGVLTVSNCTFTGDVAAMPAALELDATGGAIASEAALTVAGCTFSNNQAMVQASTSAMPDSGSNSYGGAIWADGATLQITHSLFSGNKALGGAGNLDGGSAYGGAVAWVPLGGTGGGVSAVVNITGDTFTSNAAVAGDASYAGGIADGGAVEVLADQTTGLSVTVSSDAFNSDTATGGTGLYGGPARGGSLMLDAGGSSSPVFVASSDQFNGGGAHGGDGLTSEVVGRGGEANGGAVVLEAGFAGAPSFTFNSDRVVSATAQGGKGNHNTSPISDSDLDSSDGGAAQGGGVYLDAGVSAAAQFVVTAPLLASDKAVGGAGGDIDSAGQAGSGGEALGGGLFALGGNAAAPGFAIDQGSVQSCSATGGAGGRGGTGNSGINFQGGTGGQGGLSGGGGVAFDPSDTAGMVFSVTRTSFVRDTATGGSGGGGGGSSFHGGTGGQGGTGSGGGLYLGMNGDTTALQVTVARCTFSADGATGGAGGVGGAGFVGGHGGDGGGAQGGAIGLLGFFGDVSNQVTLDTDVLVSNLATGGYGGYGGLGLGSTGGAGGDGGEADGAGIYTDFQGSVQIRHSTIHFNNAMVTTGGSGSPGFTGAGADGQATAGVGGGIFILTPGSKSTVCRTADTVIAYNNAQIDPDVHGTLGSC
jgi:hypothetical protein